MNKKTYLLAVSLIAIGFIYRLIPFNLFNFTPIAAMALIGGMYINKKALAFAIPVVALFASDLILNNTVNRVFFDKAGFILYDSYMLWTYSAFLLTVVLGIWLYRKSVGTKILGGTLIASTLFFLLSNIGVFISSGLYPRNMGGLSACFIAAIPFFKYTLIGNLVFITTMVGGIEYFLNSSTKLKEAIA